jgi:hypothetical protein
MLLALVIIRPIRTAAGDGVATPYAHNVRRQDTLTFGATGWFDAELRP